MSSPQQNKSKHKYGTIHGQSPLTALHAHPGVKGDCGQVTLPAPVQEDDVTPLRVSLLAAAPPEALSEAGAQ